MYLPVFMFLFETVQYDFKYMVLHLTLNGSIKIVWLVRNDGSLLEMT